MALEILAQRECILLSVLPLVYTFVRRNYIGFSMAMSNDCGHVWRERAILSKLH